MNYIYSLSHLTFYANLVNLDFFSVPAVTNILLLNKILYFIKGKKVSSSLVLKEKYKVFHLWYY